MKHNFLLIGILFFCVNVFSQKHTVGLIKADNSKTYKGYNLIYPLDQSNLYLLDNCGRIVHTWPEASGSRPGNYAYLQTDGSVITTKRSAITTGNPIYSGGAGGTVEKRSWDNTLLWTFTQNDSFNRLHHDIEPLPNGNVLMISWEKKTAAQAVAYGRNPAFVANGELWPDKVIEVKPIGKDSSQIVWEWHLWDHLIQNFDATKPNYGKPSDFPGKVDFNFGGAGSAKNWAFSNAISYNVELDQIALSVPNFNEIWIIDHSTTTAEAAGSTGGKGKQGGDLIYRWGNPAVYGSGTAANQKLAFQHDIHWITENQADTNYGKMAVFNNRINAKYSTVNFFKPEFDKTTWTYKKNGNTFLPNDYDWTYKRPDSSAMNSQIISSVQRLPNGNTLICSGQQGYTFEITPTEEIVWEYVTPVKSGVIVSQGDSIKLGENNTFRVKRYGLDFAGFIGKDLSPKGFIELKPDTNFCQISASIGKINHSKAIKLFPNPANNTLNIEVANSELPLKNLSIYSITGKLIFEGTFTNQRNAIIDLTNIPSGFYFVSINNHTISQKLEIKH